MNFQGKAQSYEKSGAKHGITLGETSSQTDESFSSPQNSSTIYSTQSHLLAKPPYGVRNI
jgi:hypothetical protein